ncbi:MAG: hypothetical protein OXR73_25500 [Myxococcales bacterium]|nr:hypothetical protein [Myxococcales bacterium]
MLETLALLWFHVGHAVMALWSIAVCYLCVGAAVRYPDKGIGRYFAWGAALAACGYVALRLVESAMLVLASPTLGSLDSGSATILPLLPLVAMLGHQALFQALAIGACAAAFIAAFPHRAVARQRRASASKRALR